MRSISTRFLKPDKIDRTLLFFITALQIFTLLNIHYLYFFIYNLTNASRYLILIADPFIDLSL